MPRSSIIGLGVLTLCACAYSPQQPEEREGEVLSEPVDAFEKVGEPQRPVRGFSDDPDNLSTDIERLQDARRAYEAERAHQAAETRRRQERCRESGKNRKVPIEDGTGEFFCEEEP